MRDEIPRNGGGTGYGGGSPPEKPSRPPRPLPPVPPFEAAWLRAVGCGRRGKTDPAAGGADGRVGALTPGG